MNTRTPERFEKHNGEWWVFVPPYVVDGVTHYAIGGYGSRKDAEQAWSSLRRSVSKWDQEYANAGIPETPADYFPRYDGEPSTRQQNRKTRQRRQHVVENELEYEGDRATTAGDDKGNAPVDSTLLQACV